MSKDFYSDDHTIQAGAPGSSAGNLKLEGEESVSIVGARTGDYKGSIEVTDNILIKAREALLGGSYGEVAIEGADLIIGTGSISPVTLDRPCNTTIYGNLSAYTESGTHTIYTETGSIELTGDVTIDGDLTVTGVVSQSGGFSNAGDVDISTTLGGDINISANGFSYLLGNANINLTGKDINLTSTDINLTSTDANIAVSTELVISSGDDINITAEDNIWIKAGTGAAGTLTLGAGDDPGDPYIIIDESTDSIGVVSSSFNITTDTSTFYGNIVVSNETDSGYTVTITNTSSNSDADILRLELSNISSPTEINNWVQFRADGTSRGSIQGASASTAYLAIYVPTRPDPLYWAVRDDGDKLTTASGYVQYTSGAEDFGEWIPLGDESEWNITEEAKIEFLKSSILPVQEGLTLYVRDSKVWRSGPGRGMIVTHRAIMIGNQNYKEEEKLGIIMSFIGQVPALVEGAVEDGDLILPVEGANHCRAINPDQISFADYRKAIGTAWGKKLTPEVGLVNCAIGIK